MRTVSSLYPGYDDSAWRNWLSRLPQIAASISDQQTLQAARNHVFWTEHDGRRLVVKRFFNRGAWKKLVYRFTSSKARRSYDHSVRLLENGLLSPQPIAWREDWDGGWLQESYYVCAHIPFAHEARALNDDTLSNRDQKAALVGQEIARMHQAHILHRDLTPGNLLFLEDGTDDWRLHVVDNNRMRFGPVSPASGIGSLLQVDIAGRPLDIALEAYARARGIDPEICRRHYAERLRRYQLKWRLKNRTRPWRRKIGL